MKTAYVTIAVIMMGLLFGCKKSSHSSTPNNCHVCIYSRVNDTTTICDDPSAPGYETNPGINHNVFINNHYGYCIN